MKIVTMCHGGLVRSVALADVLKLHFRPTDVIPIGAGFNSRETIEMLCAWADRIVVMTESIKQRVPQAHQHKTLVCEVGPDSMTINPQGPKTRHLIDKVWHWARSHQEALGVLEHGEKL